MISKPKGISAKRWSSGALVGVVSVLMVGVPFAPAANAAATAVSATPTTQSVAAGDTATIDVSSTGTPVQISYTILSDPNGAYDAVAGGAATFPNAQACVSATQCDIPTSGTPGNIQVRVFDDANNDGTFDSGEAFSDVTVRAAGQPFSVTLAPDSATTPVGNCQKYTITAADSGGRPAAGYDINLTIDPTGTFAGNVTFCTPAGGGSTVTGAAGGNAGATLTGTVTTDEGTGTTDGQAIFGITSDTTGSATVTAASASNANVSDTSTQTWTAGGANAVTSLTVSPTTSTDYVLNEVDYTVTAKDANGNPVAGVTVSFGVTSGADSTAYPADGTIDCTNNGSGTTDQSGQTTCFLDNGGTATTDNVVFWINQTSGAGPHTGGADAGEPQATATAQFIANPPATDTITLDCPGTDVPPCELKPGTSPVTFTATVKDASNNPVSGVLVDFYFDNNGTAGTITPDFVQATTGADGKATATVTDSAPTNGNQIDVEAEAGNGANGVNDNLVATYTTPVATTFTLNPPDETVTNGGTVALVAKVVDQYGTGVSGVSVSYAVSGRNAGKSGSVTTGSDGTAAISYTDAGVNPAATTDTVQATVTSGALTGSSDSSTVHYITGSTTASTISVDVSGNGNGTTCPANANSSTTKSAALTSSNNVCAIVKNSTGEALAGKSVTLTVNIGQITAVNGGTDGISADGKSATVDTNANGIVTATVTSNTSGDQTLTFTADSASGTGTITYAAPAPADARNVTLAPANPKIDAGDSQVFTATVVDRFGNGVPNVTVSFTQTGTAGSFNGSSSASATTNANGQASVTLTTASTDSGSGSVTANIASNPANACANAAGNPAGTTTAGNCTATSTYTVAKAAASGVSVSAPRGATGKTETAHATVVNSDGSRAAGVVVNFTVTGANSASGAATTNSNGVATFSYKPHHAGLDHIRAVVQSGSHPSSTKTVRIRKTMRVTLNCSSPRPHVLKCRAATIPARDGLRVIFKKKTASGYHKFAADTTNSNGVAKIVKKGLKSGKVFRVRAHLKATSRTTAANSAGDRQVIS